MLIANETNRLPLYAASREFVRRMWRDCGEIAANFANLALQDLNKKIIETLQVNSEVLNNTHEEFKTMLLGSYIKVHSFQEARGISGMKGLHNKLS
jgi:hypothetical protein